MKRGIAAVVGCVAAMLAATPLSAQTPPQSPLDVGMVTITMDDGHQSQYDNGFPLLAARGIPATVYIVTDRLDLPWYINPYELDQMVAAGWEVGSHGVTHRPLATLTTAEIESELATSKAVLESRGYTIRSHSYPSGSFDDRVIAAARDYYETALEVSYLDLPYVTLDDLAGDEPWQLSRYHIQDGNEAEVKAYIDQAIAEKGWVIFFSHMVYADGTTDGSDLIEIADYIAEKVDAGQLRAVTMSEGWDLMHGEPPPNVAPVADAGPDVAGVVGEPVALDGSGSSDVDGVVVSWEWEFGDGGVGSGAVVSHVYGESGVFTATLTVTDDDGASDSDTVLVTVDDQPPVSGLLLNPSFEAWTSTGRLRPEHWEIDWNRSTTVLAPSDDAVDGVTSADLTSAILYNGIHQTVALSDTTLEAGDQVVVSGWLEAVVGVDAARISVKFYDGAGHAIGYGAYRAITLSDEWSYAEAATSIPAGTKTIQVQIHPTRWSAGWVEGTLRADSISLIAP